MEIGETRFVTKGVFAQRIFCSDARLCIGSGPRNISLTSLSLSAKTCAYL